MSYKVTAPLVIVPNADPDQGGDGYFYAKAVIPDGYNDERCKQLVKDGMLEKVKADKGSSSDAGDKDPTRSSSKADWVAYATDDARGDQKLSTEDAEALNRDELAEKFLGPKE